MTTRDAKQRKEVWTKAQGAAPGAPMVMVSSGHGVGWGVLRRKLAGRDYAADLREFMWGKLTHARGPNWTGDWHPTATHVVLLPAGAPHDLLDARRLAERYEADAFVGIKDLACVVKITIGKTDELITRWASIQRFAEQEFCINRSMACVAVLHVPARSGVKRDAHVHLVAPAREWDPVAGAFGGFVRPFATDQGGADLAKAWSVWS